MKLEILKINPFFMLPLVEEIFTFFNRICVRKC